MNGLWLPGAEQDHGIGDEIVLFDHFLGDVLDDRWIPSDGSDGQCVPPAINDQEGGVVRCTSGDVGAGANGVDESYLATTPFIRCDRGQIVCDWKVKHVTAITDRRCCIGLTDVAPAAGSAETPFTITAGVIASPGPTDDAVCWVYDTGATTAQWQVAGIKGQTLATAVETPVGAAPVADTYDRLRIIIDIRGTAYFYLNGEFKKKLENAVTTSVLLTPVCMIASLAAATKSIDADVVRVVGKVA